MELNFGTYWTVKVNSVHTRKFGYAGGEWILAECHLKVQRKIDTLEINRKIGTVFVIINGKWKEIVSPRTKLNTKCPLEINVNGESKFLDGNDSCVININESLSVTVTDGVDDLVVKKVVPNGTLKCNMCYSYSEGISYNIPVFFPTEKRPPVKMRFSADDILGTLKGAALKTEGFTKNEIAGEIEALMNPSS